MKKRGFELDSIHVGQRLRAPDMGRVGELAKSIDEVGLLTPPSVRVVEKMIIDGAEELSVPVLIMGLHRILALKQLGWDSVECDVYEVDALRAELMEIDENLARAELSPAEEVAHIGRRKVVWKMIQAEKVEAGGRISPTSLPDGRTKGPQHEKKFAAEVASIVGSGRNAEAVKRDVNLKIKRADTLGGDLNKIAGTSLDKGVEMDALIKMEEPQRKKLIERAVRGEHVSARPKIDSDIKARAAKEVADMLVAEIRADCWDVLKANLYAAGASNIANEFTNITGQSIMDRRYAA